MLANDLLDVVNGYVVFILYLKESYRIYIFINIRCRFLDELTIQYRIKTFIGTDSC